MSDQCLLLKSLHCHRSFEIISHSGCSLWIFDFLLLHRSNHSYQQWKLSNIQFYIIGALSALNSCIVINWETKIQTYLVQIRPSAFERCSNIFEIWIIYCDLMSSGMPAWIGDSKNSKWANPQSNKKCFRFAKKRNWK